MTYRYTITHPDQERVTQRIFPAAWTKAKALEQMDAELDGAQFGSVASFYEIEERMTDAKTKGRNGK